MTYCNGACRATPRYCNFSPFQTSFCVPMFDDLVTARSQLKVGYLDDVLHVLEKPKVTGSESWLVRRVLNRVVHFALRLTFPWFSELIPCYGMWETLWNYLYPPKIAFSVRVQEFFENINKNTYFWPIWGGCELFPPRVWLLIELELRLKNQLVACQ